MTKKESKEKRIEDIIGAAVEEFLLKGYEGASIDAIAKRAGVSKGGFYHHFPNKEVLLMEANNKLSEPVVEMCILAMNNPSPMEGLRRYMRAYLSYWVNHPKESSFLFLSMSKALQSDILMKYYSEYVKYSMEFFTDLFTRIHQTGEAVIPDPEAYALSLMGSLDGVLTYLLIDNNKNVEEMAERLERIWMIRKGDDSNE